MVRTIREKQGEEIENKSKDEIILYFQEKANSLHEKIKVPKKKLESPDNPPACAGFRKHRLELPMMPTGISICCLDAQPRITQPVAEIKRGREIRKEGTDSSPSRFSRLG
jgi:hypothetical protein